MLSSRVKLVISLFLGLVGLFGSPSFAQRRKGGGDVYVKPYFRKDGTYVDGYMRSAPDGTKSNNFSTKGNVNPYTGKDGTKNDYYSGGDSRTKIFGTPRLPNNGLSGARIGLTQLADPIARDYFNVAYSYGLSFYSKPFGDTSDALSFDVDGIYGQLDGHVSMSNGLLVAYRSFLPIANGRKYYMGAGYGVFSSIDVFETTENSAPDKRLNTVGSKVMVGVMDSFGTSFEISYLDTNSKGTTGVTFQLGFRL